MFFLGESAVSIFVIICNKYRYCIVLKIISNIDTNTVLRIITVPYSSTAGCVW